jgi:capsular polysaccharide biosynthesis protein
MASAEMGQIQDFVLVFKRRIWQVILPALFVLAGGVVYAVIVPKKYVVTTMIELLQPTLHAGNPEESPTLREVENARFHLTNVDRVEETIAAGNWEEYARLDEEEREEFILSVRDSIRVRPQPLADKSRANSSVFVEIEYADVDGKRAVSFVNALTESWVNDVVLRDKNQLYAERDEYQNAVNLAQKNFEAITKRRTDLWGEMGISVTQANMLNSRDEDPIFVELTTARESRDRVNADLEGLRAQIAALREEHDAMPVEVEVVEEDPGLDLRTKIFAYEEKKRETEQVFEGRTPENTLYKKAQREIELIDKEVAELTALQRAATERTLWVPNPARQEKAAQIAVLELQETDLKARIAKWTAEVAEKEAYHQAQIANWNELLRVNKALEHAGQELDEAASRLRLVQARIAAYNAVQEQPYRVANPARAPARPTEPNPVTIVVISLLGGFAFGLAIAFLAEYSRSCYRSVGDLSRSLGVPILGVVNRIYTRSDRRTIRSKRLVIGGSTAVILACLGWFTYAWVFDQGKLTTGIVQVVEDLRLKMR